MPQTGRPLNQPDFQEKVGIFTGGWARRGLGGEYRREGPLRTRRQDRAAARAGACGGRGLAVGGRHGQPVGRKGPQPAQPSPVQPSTWAADAITRWPLLRPAGTCCALLVHAVRALLECRVALSRRTSSSWPSWALLPPGSHNRTRCPPAETGMGAGRHAGQKVSRERLLTTRCFVSMAG